MKIDILSLEDIQASARQFLLTINDFRVVAFRGDMGAGKTTFIKALCKELGIIDNATSPTFSIVNEYHTSTDGIVYHFDFYRVEGVIEAIDMGYNLYFESGHYCFVEWPEKIEALLPDDILNVTIQETENGAREIIFDSKTLVNNN